MSTADAQSLLSVEALVKEFAHGDGSTRALDGVGFALQRGEFVAVLGKSGAGKSTLLRCLNRLVEPTGGRIVFCGQEVTSAGVRELRRIRRGIGMIFQNYNLVRRADVLTNVLSGRLGHVPAWRGMTGRFSAADRRRAENLLERLGLADKARRRADTLSGGQQQRVGIARALMQEPALLLADEPVSSLDPAATGDIMEILHLINKTDGVGILCNLHLPGLARQYADRILVLQSGKLIFDGPPSGFDDNLLK